MRPIYERLKDFVGRQEEIGLYLAKREFEWRIEVNENSVIFFDTGLPCLIPTCKIHSNSSIFGELVSNRSTQFVRFWITPYDDCFSFAIRYIDKETEEAQGHYTLLGRLNEEGEFETQPFCLHSKALTVTNQEGYVQLHQLICLLWTNTVGNKNVVCKNCPTILSGSVKEV